ncbi:KilA, N-terminal/APSES-type HTH, DNA-binding family, partial [Trichomonas vaginalis G3]|uniref:KilA, N-terminal/APSES-type HTH, DNA-binding family n=1 Tax=Trichomonas vaginalis (strain ATCC PRA-98 / G3) TaxID=412133 RepID=UPI0021E59525
MSTSENTTTVIVHEAINEEYEYIQYNKQLRLIRSVKDDMYQMQSIMNALRSTKQAYHWFEKPTDKRTFRRISSYDCFPRKTERRDSVRKSQEFGS